MTFTWKDLRKLTTQLTLFLSCCSCYTLTEPAQPLEVPVCPLENAAAEIADDPLFSLGEIIPECWWGLLNDPQLASLIEIALENNPSLQAAEARIFAALYQAEATRAALLPAISLDGDVQKDSTSKTAVFPPPPPGSGFNYPFNYTLYEAFLSFMYEIDIWNKNHNKLVAALGLMYADMAETAFSRLAISINVAQTYYHIQIDLARRELALTALQNRKQNLELIEKRFQRNIANELDLLNARNAYSATERLIISIEEDLEINRHQLFALLGMENEEPLFQVEVASCCLPKVPYPEQLPLHLIAHRPDIIAQIWLVESAVADIEVAKAGFYPDINLTGFAGYQTIHLKNFFDSKSGDSSLKFAFSLPIFTGGLLTANLRGAEVSYDEEVFEYNRLILEAVREVLDGITRLRKSRDATERLDEEAGNQDRIAELTQMKQKYNVVSDIDTLNQQQQTLYAKDAALQSKGNEIDAFLLLIKALGGGYDAYCEKEECL